MRSAIQKVSLRICETVGQASISVASCRPYDRCLTRHGGFDGLSLAWSAKTSKPQCELHYDGSCAIDENLLDAANICENEQVHIWNINNGERFITYAIKGERGSGMISVNGSAARRASVGDLLIIASFAQVHEDQVATHEPQLVFVDEHNHQVGLRHHVPTQSAPGHGTDEC